MCQNWERLVYKCERPGDLKPHKHLPKYKPRWICPDASEQATTCSRPADVSGLPYRKETEPTCYNPDRCCENLIKEAFSNWRTHRNSLKASKEKNAKSQPGKDWPESDHMCIKWGKMVEDILQWHIDSCNFTWHIDKIDKMRQETFTEDRLIELNGQVAHKSSYGWKW